MMTEQQEPLRPAPEHVVTALQAEITSLRQVRANLESDLVYLRACIEHIRADAGARIAALEARVQGMTAEDDGRLFESVAPSGE